MKKIISVLMVAVCLMMAAPAQAQLHFGVKGGLNISKLSFSKDAFKGDNKTGFFVGPMAEFTLPIIGIGADVAALYSQTDLGADGEKTMKLKTFAVPVNLKWSFGLGSMLGAYIAAGPQFDFNIGNKTWTRELSLKKSTTSFNVGAAPICPIGAQEGVPLCHLQTSKLPFLILRHAVIQRLSPFHARSI